MICFLDFSSIFIPCLLQNWRIIALAGLARLFADLSSLVGAVCIKFIVQSLSNTNSTFVTSFDNSTLDHSTVKTFELSWDEFFSDGYVIAVVILIAGVFQGVCSQSSTHLLTVAGTRSMSALQVSIL
jgi:hypothetical protein